MSELIAYPDAEALVRGHLLTRLPDIGLTLPVGSRLPNPRPAECVVLFLTGGRGRSGALISGRAQITIDSRGPSETRAVFIAERVRALVNAMPEEITSVMSVVELAWPSNLPDPNTPGQSRYTQSFVLHLTGAIL